MNADIKAMMADALDGAKQMPFPAAKPWVDLCQSAVDGDEQSAYNVLGSYIRRLRLISGGNTLTAIK